MKKWFLIGACYLWASPHAESQTGLTEYRNAIWWDGQTEYIGSRFVSGDRFVDSVGTGAATVVDLGGAIVTAPFGEGHNHNLLDVLFERSNQEYLRNGVFYVKIPGMHAPAVAPIRSALGRADTVDAIFSLGTITSPNGHPVPVFVDLLADSLYAGATYDLFAGQAFHEVSTEADVLASLQSLQSQGAEFIKAVLAISEEFDEGVTFGMNPDLLPFLVREARARSLAVTLHVETAEDFRKGVAAAVDEISHIPGLWWEQTRTADQYRLTDDDARRAADAGIAVATTTHYPNVVGEMVSISADRMAAFKEVHRHNLRLLIDAGIEIRIGSDVYDRLGTGVGANPTRGEVENLVALGVYDAKSVLSRWIDTGRKIFPNRRIGCFEPGCEASFLVFEVDPRSDLSNLDRMITVIKQGIDVTQPPTSNRT